MSFLPQQFFPVLEEIETKYEHRVNATCDFSYGTKPLGQTRTETECSKSPWLLQTVRSDWLQKFGQRSKVVFHSTAPSFRCDLYVKNQMNAEKVDYKETAFTLVSSSMMLCCSRTCSFRKATSCSSCAWSRSFKDFSFFSGGWELIFSLCNAPVEKSEHNISRWCDNNKNTRVIQARLCAHHLKVLPRQALEFLLHLLDSLSQIIVPFIQQFVLVQQGFTLLLWLSNTLQLVKRRDTISLSQRKHQNIQTNIKNWRELILSHQLIPLIHQQWVAVF